MAFGLGLGIGFGYVQRSGTAPTEEPANIAPPVIAGTPHVGQTLTASGGTWTNGPFTRAWQWYADDVEIDGATASTFLLTEAEHEADITVGVIATNVIGASDEAVSDPVGPVLLLPGVIADLIAEAESDTEVLLTFTPAANATSHEYRVDGGSPVTCDDNSGEQLVDGLTAETEYGFEVRGVNDDGTGPWSNVDSATTEEAPPIPDITPLTKLVAEGDSITLAEGNYSDLWHDANSGIAYDKVAAGGAGITGIQSEIAATMGEEPSHLTALIGANDLFSFTPEAYLAECEEYVGLAKAIDPAVKVGFCGILPVDEARLPGYYAGFNAKRHATNALLRASTVIDFYVPIGEHPDLGDAAAEDEGWSHDGLHWTGFGYTAMAQAYTGVMDAIRDEATGNVPSAFTFTDLNNVALESVQRGRIVVTGLGMGETATASISGDGEFRRGHGSFGTSPFSVMNGDVVEVEIEASDEATTATSATVTIGGVSDTFTVTTAGLSDMGVVQGSGSRFDNIGPFTPTPHLFEDVAFAAGRPFVAVAKNTASEWQYVTIGGEPCTMVASVGTQHAVFVCDEELSAGDHDVVVAANSHYQATIYPGVLTDSGDCVAVGSSVLGPAFRAGPDDTIGATSLTVPSGGLGILFGYSATGVSSYYDLTLLEDFADDQFLASFTASGYPKFQQADYGYTYLLAVAFSQSEE